MWRKGLYYMCVGAFPTSLFFIAISIGVGGEVPWFMGVWGVLTGIGLLTLKKYRKMKG